MTEIKLTLDDPKQVVMRLRHAVELLDACAPLSYLADSIEEQVKPPIEEPAEWGSVVRARRVGYGSEDTVTLRWQRQNNLGDAWISEPAGDLGVRYHSDWSYLHNPEVLRVGIGEPVPTDVDEFMLSAGFDPTPAQEASYLRGVEDFAAKVRREVAALRSTVITAPEKRTCDDALALVAALLGES